MKLKKIALAVLAVALVAALSVAGTMALLNQKANGGDGVVNTFQSYYIDPNGPLASTFTLQEHKAEQQADGSYKIAANAETTTSWSYKLMPGVVVEKDPFVTITGKTEVPARLFVEVVGELPECDWDMDDKWEAVKASGAQMTGAKGGKLYVWEDILAQNDGTLVYNIIKGKKITVDKDAGLSSFAGNGKNLTFYAYLAQATVVVGDENSNDPAEIYAACFLAPSGDSTT